MKLNKYIGILVSGAVALTLSVSCESDESFLQEKPKALLTTENAFQSSEQVLNTLLTGYNKLNNVYFAGMMGYSYTLGTDLLDAKYSMGMSSHYSDFTTAWSSTSSVPKNLWDMFYQIISYSNLALSKLDEVTWESDSVRDRIEAEAYFLRGFSYLRLAELFGGVPLVLEYSETPDYGYNRASRLETYNVAVSDLEKAYAGLPEKIGNENGRAGKGAAGMFLSEALLARGVEDGDNKTDFNSAATYAQNVINMHPMMTSRFGVRLPDATGSNNGVANAFPEGNVFSDLFCADNIRSTENTEAIWILKTAKNYEEYSTNGGASCSTVGTTPALQDFEWSSDYVESGAATGPWKAFSAKYGSVMGPAFMGGYGWGCTTPTWFASYTMWDAEHNANSTEDYRYVEDVTVKTTYLCCDENHSLYEQKIGWDKIDHSTPERAGIFYPIFYKESPFSNWDFDENQPAGWLGKYSTYYRSKYVARTSEVYLLLAEAKLRAGDQPGADAALNAVRTRANAKRIDNITIDTILDERGRELLYEEFRWGTLLRMKPSEWKSRIYNYGMYSARTGDTIYPEIRRWAEYTDDIKFDYFPIPQTYIDLNTASDGMTQNAGW